VPHPTHAVRVTSDGSVTITISTDGANNTSRMNLSGHVVHVTIFSSMFTTACSLVVGFGLVLVFWCLVGKLVCTHICATLGCNNCRRPISDAIFAVNCVNDTGRATMTTESSTNT